MWMILLSGQGVSWMGAGTRMKSTQHGLPLQQNLQMLLGTNRPRKLWRLKDSLQKVWGQKQTWFLPVHKGYPKAFPELVVVYMQIQRCREVITCKYMDVCVRVQIRSASYVMQVVLSRRVAATASAAGLGRKAGLRARAVVGQWQARPAGGRVHRSRKAKAAGSADEARGCRARSDRRSGRQEDHGGPPRAGEVQSRRREPDGVDLGAAAGTPTCGRSESAW